MTDQPTPASCECGRPTFRRGLCTSCYRDVPKRRQRAQEDVVEDVEWLILCGEVHPETVARRVGYSDPNSLYRTLHRADRGDLVDQLRRPITR